MWTRVSDFYSFFLSFFLSFSFSFFSKLKCLFGFKMLSIFLDSNFTKINDIEFLPQKLRVPLEGNFQCTDATQGHVSNLNS